jgi:hypothetical protein
MQKLTIEQELQVEFAKETVRAYLVDYLRRDGRPNLDQYIKSLLPDVIELSHKLAKGLIETWPESPAIDPVAVAGIRAADNLIAAAVAEDKKAEPFSQASDLQRGESKQAAQTAPRNTGPAGRGSGERAQAK